MRLLTLAEYESAVDIVYSLGDVIDRGPESQRTLEWFVGRPGAYLLLGNHEALMMQSAEDHHARQIWSRHGGEWGHRLEAREQFLYTCMLRTLPLTAEISYGADSYRVGLVHADVPAGLPWKKMQKVQSESGDSVNDESLSASVQAIWGRRRFKTDEVMRKLPRDQLTAEAKMRIWPRIQPVRGVDRLICGHTVIDDFAPRGRGNVLWIETGAAYGGRLTAVDPLKQVYWQVGQKDAQTWGPVPLPRLDPVSRVYRPTRAEKAEFEAPEGVWRKKLGPNVGGRE